VSLTHICEGGEVPTSVDALFTATEPCSLTVAVSNGGTARTVTLYVNPGTRRRIGPENQALAIGAAWPPSAPYGPIVLDTGDSIDGVASGAGVDWVITGHGIT
jgi:hypothetical protein